MCKQIGFFLFVTFLSDCSIKKNRPCKFSGGKQSYRYLGGKLPFPTPLEDGNYVYGGPMSICRFQVPVTCAQPGFWNGWFEPCHVTRLTSRNECYLTMVTACSSLAQPCRLLHCARVWLCETKLVHKHIRREAKCEAKTEQRLSVSLGKGIY